MNREEAKNKILKRLYEIAMKDGIRTTMLKSGFYNLEPIAKEEGIDGELLKGVFEELCKDGYLDYLFTWMAVRPSPKALTYCEQNGLIDERFVKRQEEVRIKILEALFDLEEEEPRANSIFRIWESQIREKADIDELESDNNIYFLYTLGLVNGNPFWNEWTPTPDGKKKVREYQRMRRFNELKKSLNPQERGHKFEDLLEEVLKEEGCETWKRRRHEGAEIDIQFKYNFHFFLVSCKWQKKKVGGETVGALIERGDKLDCEAYILISMSGFTRESIKSKRSSKLIFFGPGDIEKVFHVEIFQSRKLFTELLDEKIKERRVSGKVLVDDQAYS